MTVPFYALSSQMFVPMLRSLSALLDKGAEYAEAKKFDPNILASARLAPDMFPLTKQIQIACDMAKGAAARLTGNEPPKFEDNEQTIDELKTRIAKTIAYVETVPESSFEGAETRQINFTLRDKMYLEADGLRYLTDWAIPHFYFHVVTAYNILRHNGVDLSKRDYLSHAGDIVKERS